jgi:membrane-associated protease RseP (regulator of RpoE activity)
MQFRKILTVLALASVASFASEVFGGIGVTIYGISEGVQVVEVIPGTPAAEAGILPGDKIIAVDQVSLKGLTQDQSIEKLRGEAGRPVEATVLREGEKLSMVMRRAQLTVQDIDAGSLSAWYGNKLNQFDAEEIKVFAESKAKETATLLGVMHQGHLISSEAKVAPDDVVGVFIDQKPVFETPAVSNLTKKASSSLKAFNRKVIGFELFKEGPASIKILDPNGEEVQVIDHQNGLSGINSVTWDGSKIPSGRYMIRIEQNGAVSGHFAVLR